MKQAEGKGRIVAIRVSDADFELLDGLKKMKGIGWNQLLLEPVETAYGVMLETARRKVEEKLAEEPKAEKPKKSKGKKAEKEELPTTETELVAEVFLGEKEAETEG